MSSLLDQLNPQQRAAVELSEGPLLILAGAGSGKTRVITYRIAHLIQARGVRPESILAVTFTNKAAEQMRERVAALLAPSQAAGHATTTGEDPSALRATDHRQLTRANRGGPHISTFHSFCVRVLRHGIERLGYSSDFSIYDTDDQERVIKACIHELGLHQLFQAPRAALSRISHAKNRGLTPEELYQQAVDSTTEKTASVYDLYERKLRQANALDFDDLLLKTVSLFRKAPDVCEWYNRRFRYILVDEYQDTNRIQYRLIRYLTQAHQNLCTVGDEDQSIYSWRGADIQNILSFEKDYPQAAIIRLEQNYRSTQLILDAATAVVSNNRARKGKTLWTERSKGQRVGLFEAWDADEEAQFVAEEVARALAAGPDKNVGVLYRTNAQSRLLEEALRRNQTAYRVVGGFSFYARAEIKDALAYARLASNLRDSASLLRIINTPPRGIGKTTVEGLEAIARERNVSHWEALEQLLISRQGLTPRALKSLDHFHKIVKDLVANRERLSLGEFFKSVLDRTQYLKMLQSEGLPESESRIENLMELVNAAAEAEERDETLADFLDHAALVSDADDFDERARVTLMTLHCAKGLEFSQVFFVGLEEGLCPHKLSLAEEASIEEERRLCYVGMTRAQDRLVLSWAGERRFFGYESFGGTQPSRFLKEIPGRLIDHLDLTGTGTGRKATKPWDKALNSPESVDRLFQERGVKLRVQQSSSGLAFSAPRRQARWKLGTRVRHPKYGLGTVVGCEGDGEDAKLTVSFPGYGQKRLVEKFASLEKA